MKQNAQPDISFFTDILTEPLNPLIETAIDQGKIPIGYTCSHVPDVLLSVDNLLPIRVRAPGVSGTEIADIYLSSVTCSYTRSLLELAMDDQYEFLGGWVFAASCDHMRRLYDNLNYLLQPDFIHVLDVPHRFGDNTLAWFREDLRILMNKISEHFAIQINESNLNQAIREHNEYNTLLMSIGGLRRDKHPRLSGVEYQTLSLASRLAPKKILTPRLQDIYTALCSRNGITDYRARLLVVGGQMDDLGYLQAIESTGGIVVADHLCTSLKPDDVPIRTDRDPLDALARHYLGRIACPRMMEALDDRIAAIRNTLDDYRVDGVIIEYVKFCDTWGIEAGLIADALRKQGIPVLCLEREYRLSGEGQLKTRIQAFIESMGK